VFRGARVAEHGTRRDNSFPQGEISLIVMVGFTG